jgi:hypothetical protein
MDLIGELDNLEPADSGEEEHDGPGLTEEELNAEFNAIVSETSPVNVDTDDLHEEEWMLDEDEIEESSDESLPEMEQILENEYVM